MAQNQQTPPSGNDVAGSALFKKFLSAAEGYIRQPTRLKSLLTDAYKKASQKNDVGTLAHEAWETLQTMFRLIKASMSGEYKGVPTTTVAAAVAVLVYFLSPIDLIPDFIPVIGLLDDVALVAWFSMTLKGEMDRFHEWELTRPAVVATADGDYSADRAEPAAQSAKNAGTGSASYSNTDSGISSPDSSSPRPVHEAGPDAAPTQPGESAKNAGTTTVSANTTDSRHEPNMQDTDTGSNV